MSRSARGSRDHLTVCFALVLLTSKGEHLRTRRDETPHHHVCTTERWKENIVNFIVTLVSVVDVYLTVSITTDTDTTDTVYFDLCPLTVDR